MKKKEQEREPDLAQGGQEGEKAKRRHGRLYYITVAACALVLIAAIVLMAVFLSPAATSETLEEPDETEETETPDDGEEEEPDEDVDTEVVFSLFADRKTKSRFCV